jgi:hypothetical protein
MIDLTKYFDLTKPFQNSLQYPKEYNPRVHGPYNPARFYGKRKILNEFKLTQIPFFLN